MNMRIWIDGRLVPRDEAKVSVFDHGLLYGDGVFEGIRIYARRVFRLDAHLARPEASAHAIGLELPMDRRALAAAVIETVTANRQEDGYIRLVVTRGEGPLGLDPRTCAKPSVIIIVTALAIYPPEQYANGIRVVTAATRQVPAASVDPRPTARSTASRRASSASSRSPRGTHSKSGASRATTSSSPTSASSRAPARRSSPS